jgi:hypothetical protein
LNSIDDILDHVYVMGDQTTTDYDSALYLRWKKKGNNIVARFVLSFISTTFNDWETVCADKKNDIDIKTRLL